MKSTERRLRAREEVLNVKPPKPVRCVIVEPHETLEDVLAREGIDEQEYFLIVRMIIEPGSAAALDATAQHAARLTANDIMDADVVARKRASNGVETDTLSVHLEQFSEGKQ